MLVGTVRDRGRKFPGYIPLFPRTDAGRFSVFRVDFLVFLLKIWRNNVKLPHIELQKIDRRAYMMHLLRKVHPLLLPYTVVESRKNPRK